MRKSGQDLSSTEGTHIHRKIHTHREQHTYTRARAHHGLLCYIKTSGSLFDFSSPV